MFVEPDPTGFESVTIAEDAEQRGISRHFQPDSPSASHVEVARLDTTHGEPHFDRVYRLDQPKEWVGHDYTDADARQTLLTNWRADADQFFENHY